MSGREPVEQARPATSAKGWSVGQVRVECMVPFGVLKAPYPPRRGGSDGNKVAHVISFPSPAICGSISLWRTFQVSLKGTRKVVGPIQGGYTCAG